MGNRREFLGEAFGALAARWASSQAGDNNVQQDTFHTPLCDVLGISYPVLQAPMAGVAGPALVAAVCEAGGMGILPGIGLTPDDLRRHIAEVRSRTKRPFGVNLVLHSALRTPIDPATIPKDTVNGVHGILNRFRDRLGIPHRNEPPPRLPDVLSALLQVIVEERVALFSTGLGLPTAEMVKTCRQAGIKVMCMVTTLYDALEAERLGADVVAAQGSEAGGHRSLGVKPKTPESAAIGSIALVPQIAQAVRVPVVATGGVTDGRGLAASIMLGAAGIMMGTRFIATVESTAPAFHKKAVVGGDGSETTLSDAFTGHYARFLRNEYTEEYRASGAPVFPPVLQQMAARDIVEAAAKQGVPGFYTLYAGQGIGLIETIPSAGEIVRSVITEARQAIQSAPRRLGIEGSA